LIEVVWIIEVEVLKFGGSILRSFEDFENVADIVASEIEQSRVPVCVVSAMKGVTDRIINDLDSSGSEVDLRPLMQDLSSLHMSAAPPEGDLSELSGELEKLEHVMSYINSSGELNPSVYAYAVSRGENFSSRVLSQHLRVRGVESSCFYGEELLVTDDNLSDASVDLDQTCKRVEKTFIPCLEAGRVPIVAGFSGRSSGGRVTILGRGGSDDTAACLGYCLEASRIVKYTDMDGVMTLDPKFMDEMRRDPETRSILGDAPPPRVVPYLTYIEASELLREGRTKVAHYKVLNSLIMREIRFQIKNVLRPEDAGTRIGPEEGNHVEDSRGRPKVISFQRNLYGLKLLPTQSLTPTEVYARVFKALSKEGVDIRYMSTSGYQVSFLMPKADADRALKTLGGLDAVVEAIPLEGRKGTFSLIGSGMRGVRGLFSQITGSIARSGVNIEQATQPNSENIIRFAVDDSDIPRAVAALYVEFFGC
jgi:aspartate kinase